MGLLRKLRGPSTTTITLHLLHFGEGLGVNFLAKKAGLKILSVTPGSAADRAKLSPGMTIVSLNGRKTRCQADAIQAIATVREKHLTSFEVEVLPTSSGFSSDSSTDDSCGSSVNSSEASAPSSPFSRALMRPLLASYAGTLQADLLKKGVEVFTIDPAGELGMEVCDYWVTRKGKKRRCAMITKVDPTGNAAKGGVSTGHIVSINGTLDISSTAELKEILKDMRESGQLVSLYVSPIDAKVLSPRDDDTSAAENRRYTPPAFPLC
eukprot:Sspe_Gene.89170::Locus_60995_Transcript_1_1_Confidence_1.000_Length_1209::g.89170::m.89170